MDHPLVSFAIPCYNHEKYIGETLESCVSQTYRNIEVIVVDDASTDGSRQVIEEYVRRYPQLIRAEFNQTNLGQALTARKAVRMTRGDYIAGIGSDDISLPHRIEAGLDLLRTNPSLGAVFSCVEVIDGNGKRIASPIEQVFNAQYDNLRWRLLSGNCLCGPTVLARGELIRRHRPNSALRYVEDFDQWLRVLDDHEIHRANDIWVQYRQHGNNLSIFTHDTAPVAPHYESAICIIRALQRWPVEKLFSLQSPVGTPQHASEVAQCHALLAEHCLTMDERCFGRPYLYTPEAYRQLVIACEHDPENELANRLLPEAWRRLGDTGRADGGKPTAFVDWQRSSTVTLTPTKPQQLPDEKIVAFRAWQSRRSYREIDGEHLARRMHDHWFARPRFTLLIDANDTTLSDRTLASLDTQFYSQWHAILVGGSTAGNPRASTAPAGTMAAECLARIGHTSGDDWVILLPAGTQLEAHTLYTLADHINLKPQWQAIYADDASPEGVPRFKPHFDPVLLAGGDYLGPLAVTSHALSALAPEAPLSPGLAHALAWQLCGALGDSGIGHIPDVLYTLTPEPLPLVLVRACAEAHVARIGLSAHQADAPANSANWLLPDCPTPPPVTLIASEDTLRSLATVTAYPQLAQRCLSAPTPAALAESIAQADTDLVLVSLGTVRPATPEWLLMLVASLNGWQASAAAPAILDDESRLESAGMALGIGGSLGPVLPGTPFGQPGDSLLRALLPHRVAAVNAEIMLISRAALTTAGNLDTSYASLTACLSDACLRLHDSGRHLIWTPLVQMVRVRPPENIFQESPHRFVRRWLPALVSDPWWNRNLSLQDGRGHAETELVPRWTPERHDALRVLALPLPPSGQAEYRMTAPLRMLDAKGLLQSLSACEPIAGNERAPSPTELARLAPDVLYAQAIVDDVRLQGYIACARENRDVFRIFSLDDRISDIPRYNDAHRALPQALVKERMNLALSCSDRLIVSTRPLAELYAGQVADIRIVPNRLEKALWCGLAEQPRPPRKNARPRIGWAGAIQHAGDLAIIAPVVAALADEVDWVFFGMIPPGCERYVAEFHPPVKPYAAYPAKLASLDLDLALAPLEINVFNEAKSNLRLLEYGILGWPVIASDILPFQENDAPVCRVPNNANAWLAAIRARLADPALRREEATRLQDWVNAHYLLEDHPEDWLSALTPTPLASRPRHSRLIDIIPTADLADVQGGWDPGIADNRPRILAYSQTTLTHDYRAASPLRALRDAGLARTLLYGRRDANTVSCLSSHEIEQLAPTASYWNFIVDDLRLEQGLKRCVRDFPDLLRVYGLDDRIGNLPDSHPQAARFAGPLLDRRVREALALSHRLIVTTPALAELYRPLVETVHIVPNRLEKALWNNIAPPQRRENRRRPRVGWAGAPQHQGDLAVITEVVAELAGEVDWVFFGMVPPGCESHVREFHPPVPFTAYPEKLATLDLDIAIAPLEINLFNEAKSNLRLLDYGFLGWPVVCTDIAPYRDGKPPVMRVANTPTAWRNAIRALIANPEERTRLGQALRQWVCADYLLEEHLEDWQAALRPR